MNTIISRCRWSYRRRLRQTHGGRHLKFPERTPMSNMLLSVMDKAGIHMDKLGDSTGKLDI